MARTTTSQAVPAAAIPPTAPSLADTRASIAKYFPMGSVMGGGQNSPISLHSVHPLLFATVWALIGEVMVGQGVLGRPVGERIAKEVSITNRCPICITAHAMMEVAAMQAAREEERRQNNNYNNSSSRKSSGEGSVASRTSSTMDNEASNSDATTVAAVEAEDAIQYAKVLHQETQRAAQGNTITTTTTTSFPSLDERAKAEAAIVVLLFEHMNRVVSVIMGEAMSTAMFGIPEVVAGPMESETFMGKMNRWIMGPLLRGHFRKDKTPPSGFTAKLFDEKVTGEQTVPLLPSHLQGAVRAGPGRCRALVRWNVVVEAVATEEPIRSLVTPASMAKIAAVRKDLESVCLSPRVATSHLADCVQDVPEERQRAALLGILLVSSVPKLAHRSEEWKQVQQVLGVEVARTVVIWWSMKLSLEQAKGLE